VQRAAGIPVPSEQNKQHSRRFFCPLRQEVFARTGLRPGFSLSSLSSTAELFHKGEQMTTKKKKAPTTKRREVEAFYGKTISFT
jgi:hypothetical protein